MDKALISIIVPVYKVEEYLDECVKSILGQTYDNLEVILVDDGSPDNCPDMCDKWALKDERAKVIHKENAGASAARNAGLNVATGEYIGFVDSDDYIAPEMYETMLSALENSDKKMAMCAACRVNPDGSIIYYLPKCKRTLYTAKQAVDAMLYGELDVSVWSKLFCREVFEGLRFPEGEINEEIPLIVPTSVASNGVVRVDKIFYYYRVREGSITGGQVFSDDMISVIQTLRV